MGEGGGYIANEEKRPPIADAIVDALKGPHWLHSALRRASKAAKPSGPSLTDSKLASSLKTTSEKSAPSAERPTTAPLERSSSDSAMSERKDFSKE
jgi:hypothetical protein